MNANVIYFDDLEKDTWNKEIKKLQGNRDLCSWNLIKYYMSFNNMMNKSFLYYFERKLVAAVILGILKLHDNKKVFCLGNETIYCPAPLFAEDLTVPIRKKHYDKVFNDIFEIGRSNGVSKFNLLAHPIVYKNQSLDISSENQFEHLKWLKKLRIMNTLIIKLELPMEKLWENLNPDRRRNINKSLKKKIVIELFDKTSNKGELDLIFKSFQKAHFLSAGKKTRSDESWVEMKKILIAGEADLFVMKKGNVSISYLFCRNYDRVARSSSQVNIEEFEKEYHPRHLLEWHAINHYKKKKYKFYDVGFKLFDYENYKFSEKNKTISEFNEKYGANIFPVAQFQTNI